MKSNLDAGLVELGETHGFNCCGVHCSQCVICGNELAFAGYVPAGKCPCGKGTIRSLPMANISVHQGGGVIVPRDVVVEKVQAVLARHPELVSMDLLDEALEPILMRFKLDPGCPAKERDGWTGFVNEWLFSTYSIVDEKTGELVTLPSLALMASDGRILRLTNSEPAVRSWLALIREIGFDRVKKGLNVVCRLRESQTAGRHYWQLLPA